MGSLMVVSFLVWCVLLGIGKVPFVLLARAGSSFL